MSKDTKDLESCVILNVSRLCHFERSFWILFLGGVGIDFKRERERERERERLIRFEYSSSSTYIYLDSIFTQSYIFCVLREREREIVENRREERERGE